MQYFGAWPKTWLQTQLSPNYFYFYPLQILFLTTLAHNNPNTFVSAYLHICFSQQKPLSPKSMMSY